MFCRRARSDPSPSMTTVAGACRSGHPAAFAIATARNRTSNPLIGTRRPTDNTTRPLKPRAVRVACRVVRSGAVRTVLAAGTMGATRPAAIPVKRAKRSRKSALTKIRSSVWRASRRPNAAPPGIRSKSATSPECAYAVNGRCGATAAAAKPHGTSQCATTRSHERDRSRIRSHKPAQKKNACVQALAPPRSKVSGAPAPKKSGAAPPATGIAIRSTWTAGPRSGRSRAAAVRAVVAACVPFAKAVTSSGGETPAAMASVSSSAGAVPAATASVSSSAGAVPAAMTSTIWPSSTQACTASSTKQPAKSPGCLGNDVVTTPVVTRIPSRFGFWRGPARAFFQNRVVLVTRRTRPGMRRRGAGETRSGKRQSAI